MKSINVFDECSFDEFANNSLKDNIEMINNNNANKTKEELNEKNILSPLNQSKTGGRIYDLLSQTKTMIVK
jgi:hypothetical protein